MGDKIIKILYVYVCMGISTRLYYSIFSKCVMWLEESVELYVHTVLCFNQYWRSWQLHAFYFPIKIKTLDAYCLCLCVVRVSVLITKFYNLFRSRKGVKNINLQNKFGLWLTTIKLILTPLFPSLWGSAPRSLLVMPEKGV